MPYQIVNRTSGTVLLLRLLSGRTIHLAPGDWTDDLDGAEINGNPRLSTLLDRHLITVEDSSSARSATTKSTTTKSTTTKSTTKESAPSKAGTAKAKESKAEDSEGSASSKGDNR